MVYRTPMQKDQSTLFVSNVYKFTNFIDFPKLGGNVE